VSVRSRVYKNVLGREEVATGLRPNLKCKMLSTDSEKNSADLKVEVHIEEKHETSEAIEAHYDPAFLKKTMYVFLRLPS